MVPLSVVSLTEVRVHPSQKIKKERNEFLNMCDKSSILLDVNILHKLCLYFYLVTVLY